MTVGLERKAHQIFRLIFSLYTEVAEYKLLRSELKYFVSLKKI